MNFLNHNSEPVQKPRKSGYVKVIGTLLVLLALLGSAGAAYYFYNQWNVLKKNPNVAASDETKSLVENVGKLILLPTGEQPTIATVTDLTPLKGQVFFANAKVGFKVLVYEKAKTAYLYDPVDNKVINVSPITTDATAQTSGSTTTNTTPPGTAPETKK